MTEDTQKWWREAKMGLSVEKLRAEGFTHEDFETE